MSQGLLNEKISDLEKSILQIKRELRSYLDHPQNELLPKLPLVVTSSDRISLALEKDKLVIKQKNRAIGTLTLEKG